MKALLVHHIPSLVVPPSIVAVTANKIRVSLLGQQHSTTFEKPELFQENQLQMEQSALLMLPD
jgi:hypothetical protein